MCGPQTGALSAAGLVDEKKIRIAVSIRVQLMVSLSRIDVRFFLSGG
jgi:hypothetical protein